MGYTRDNRLPAGISFLGRPWSEGRLIQLVFDYEHLALKDIRIGQLLGDITAIMRDHAIYLPADLALLFKALITLEGLGRRLDPDFQLVAHLGPFVRRVLTERYAPRAMARSSGNVNMGARPRMASASGMTVSEDSAIITM